MTAPVKRDLKPAGDPPIKATMLTTLAAICPACNDGNFGIKHKPGRYGPWGCKSCGARWTFEIDGENVEMTRMELDDKPAWLIVRIGEEEPPIYAVVDHPFYAHGADDTPEQRDCHTRFWVEEHTCPTNIVPVDALVSDGDADPHGLLTFVAQVPKASWYETEPAAGWAAMISAAVSQ